MAVEFVFQTEKKAASPAVSKKKAAAAAAAAGAGNGAGSDPEKAQLLQREGEACLVSALTNFKAAVVLGGASDDLKVIVQQLEVVLGAI